MPNRNLKKRKNQIQTSFKFQFEKLKKNQKMKMKIKICTKQTLIICHASLGGLDVFLESNFSLEK